jgi:hypothetical protein
MAKMSYSDIINYLHSFASVIFMPENKNFIYGFIAFLCGALLAFYGWGSPLNFLYAGLKYMCTFFHEIGHTIFAWMYGIPAFPIFDFKYGGGYSVQLSDRSWPLQIVVWGMMAYGLYNIRDRMKPVFLYPLAGFCVVMGLLRFTDFFEDVILFMGHGATAIIGGFMLARGIYGVFLTRPSERWLNVFVGAFFILDQVKMCDALLHDVEYQMLYETQKGGHGMGDLTRIADNHLWTQDSVAVFTMIFTIAIAVAVPMITAVIVRRYASNPESF